MRTLLLVAFVLTACTKNESPPPPTPTKPVAPSASIAAPAPVVLRSDDPMARDIARAVDDLAARPDVPIPADVAAKAVDPTKLVGTWSILEMIPRHNGVLGTPEPPIVPGAWVFTADGHWQKTGGNEIAGTFALTSSSLVISALGMPLDYEVVKLTPTELEVRQTNVYGTERFETTTRLARTK